MLFTFSSNAKSADSLNKLFKKLDSVNDPSMCVLLLIESKINAISRNTTDFLKI